MNDLPDLNMNKMPSLIISNHTDALIPDQEI
jgi:hypothetical protein